MPDESQPPTPDNAEASVPRRPSRASIPLPGSRPPPEGLSWPPPSVPTAAAATEGLPAPAPLPRAPSSTALPQVSAAARTASATDLPPGLIPARASSPSALPRTPTPPPPAASALPPLPAMPAPSALPPLPPPPAVSALPPLSAAPLPRASTSAGLPTPLPLPRASEAAAQPARPAPKSLTPPPVSPPPSPFFEEKTAVRSAAPELLAMAMSAQPSPAEAPAPEPGTPPFGTLRPTWTTPEAPGPDAPPADEPLADSLAPPAVPPVTPALSEPLESLDLSDEEPPASAEPPLPELEEAAAPAPRPRRLRGALLALAACALLAAGVGVGVRRPHVLQLPAQLASLQRTPVPAARAGRLVTVPPAPGTQLEAGASVAQLEDPRLEEESRQVGEALRLAEEALTRLTTRAKAGVSSRVLKAERRRVATLSRAVAAVEKKLARLERRRRAQRLVAREQARRERLQQGLEEARARLALTEEAAQPQALARREAEVQRLREERARLLSALEELHVRTPKGGTVVSVLSQAAAGREVSAGEVLAELVPTGRPRVELSTSHPDARQLQKGMAFSFRTPGAQLAGTVLAVWPGPTGTLLTVELEALPLPPQAGLAGTLHVSAGERPLAADALDSVLSLAR